MDDLYAMLSECNLVGNPREWWMDSGATRHVCANKELFSTFALVQVEKKIYMANSATAKVEGTGKVCLKMTSSKVLTLNNVLYVSELRKNLISVSLLDKNGFKCLPQNLWGEAILTANRILNRVFHSKTQAIPYEKWKGRKPNLKYFKVWGRLAKVQVSMPKRVKIGPKTVDCVFIGYAKSSKACQVLVHKLEYPDINENTVIKSDNVKFLENIHPYKTRHEQSSGGSK
ncbi:hypothetical protein BC332_19577 [Capsicum chinense]|nr:hypothetical protein BC332_19577 [Capsicum chinense]